MEICINQQNSKPFKEYKPQNCYQEETQQSKNCQQQKAVAGFDINQEVQTVIGGEIDQKIQYQLTGIQSQIRQQSSEKYEEQHQQNNQFAKQIENELQYFQIHANITSPSKVMPSTISTNSQISSLTKNSRRYSSQYSGVPSSNQMQQQQIHAKLDLQSPLASFQNFCNNINYCNNSGIINGINNNNINNISIASVRSIRSPSRSQKHQQISNLCQQLEQDYGLCKVVYLQMCNELKQKKDLVEYKQRRTVRQIHNLTAILQKERTQSQYEIDTFNVNISLGNRREVVEKIFKEQNKLDNNVNMVLQLVAKIMPMKQKVQAIITEEDISDDAAAMFAATTAQRLHQNKNNLRENTLPIETDLKRMMSEKASLIYKVKEEQEKLNALEEMQIMTKEDFNSRMMQNTEFTCEYEDLDNWLEEIKQRFDKESQYICLDLQASNQIIELQKKISEQRLDIERREQEKNAQDQQLATQQERLEESKQKLVQLRLVKSAQSGIGSKTVAQITYIEDYIRACLDDQGRRYFTEMQKLFDTEQMAAVIAKDQESVPRQQHPYYQEQMLSTIKQFQGIIEQELLWLLDQNQQIPIQKQSDTSAAINLINRQLQQHQSSLKTNNKHHINQFSNLHLQQLTPKQAALKDIATCKKNLLLNAEISPQSDLFMIFTLLMSFDQLVLNMINSLKIPAEKEIIEKKLVELLQIRIGNFEEGFNCQRQITAEQQKNAAIQDSISELEIGRQRVTVELSQMLKAQSFSKEQLHSIEQSQAQLQQQFNSVVEIECKQFIEKYLTQKEVVFRDVRFKFGKNYSSKLEQDIKNEYYAINNQHLTKVRQQIQEIHQRMKHINKLRAKNMEYIDIELRPALLTVLQNVKQTEAKIDLICSDILKTSSLEKQQFDQLNMVLRDYLTTEGGKTIRSSTNKNEDMQVIERELVQTQERDDDNEYNFYISLFLNKNDCLTPFGRQKLLEDKIINLQQDLDQMNQREIKEINELEQKITHQELSMLDQKANIEKIKLNLQNEINSQQQQQVLQSPLGDISSGCINKSQFNNNFINQNVKVKRGHSFTNQGQAIIETPQNVQNKLVEHIDEGQQNLNSNTNQDQKIKKSQKIQNLNSPCLINNSFTSNQTNSSCLQDNQVRNNKIKERSSKSFHGGGSSFGEPKFGKITINIENLVCVQPNLENQYNKQTPFIQQNSSTKNNALGTQILPMLQPLITLDYFDSSQNQLQKQENNFTICNITATEQGQSQINNSQTNYIQNINKNRGSGLNNEFFQSNYLKKAGDSLDQKDFQIINNNQYYRSPQSHQPNSFNDINTNISICSPNYSRVNSQEKIAKLEHQAVQSIPESDININQSLLNTNNKPSKKIFSNQKVDSTNKDKQNCQDKTGQLQLNLSLTNIQSPTNNSNSLQSQLQIIQNQQSQIKNNLNQSFGKSDYTQDNFQLDESSQICHTINKSEINNANIVSGEYFSNNNKENSLFLKDLTSLNCSQQVDPISQRGIIIYKMFGINKGSLLKKQIFDPIINVNQKPENYGYGKRMFKFNNNNESIEIYNLTCGNKRKFILESNYKANQLCYLTIHKQILNLLKDQERILIEKQNKDQYQFIPFGFEVAKLGRIECLANGIIDLLEIFNLFESLVEKYKIKNNFKK